MDKNTLFFLIDKYLNGTATTEEKALLDKYYDRLEKTASSNLSSQEKAVLKEEMYRNILHNISGSKIIPIYKRSIFRRVAAAASILLVLSTGAYFLFFKNEQKQIAKTEINNDVAPGKTGAILTLTNGKTIVLDTAHNGKILDNFTKSDESITVESADMEYATLTTPKARTQTLTLSDGSKVWLNAASSIHFPTVFTGNERLVEITGEVYFEITHNAKMPFRVKVGSEVIEDIGTVFNVNAYNDEPSIKTTLLSGAIKMKGIILKPGQQGQIAGNKFTVTDNTDIEQVVAWKNGFFKFKNASTEELMRQLSRWYDVEVSYEGNIPEHRFVGGVSRDYNLSEVLKVLEASDVHFRIDGKRIIVKP